MKSPVTCPKCGAQPQHLNSPGNHRHRYDTRRHPGVALILAGIWMLRNAVPESAPRWKCPDCGHEF